MTFSAAKIAPALDGELPNFTRKPVESTTIQRLKDLELENSRLRKAVSDLTLDKLILQEAARGNF
jgi:hypothetical protein